MAQDVKALMCPWAHLSHLLLSINIAEPIWVCYADLFGQLAALPARPANTEEFMGKFYMIYHV